MIIKTYWKPDHPNPDDMKEEKEILAKEEAKKQQEKESESAKLLRKYLESL